MGIQKGEINLLWSKIRKFGILKHDSFVSISVSLLMVKKCRRLQLRQRQKANANGTNLAISSVDLKRISKVNVAIKNIRGRVQLAIIAICRIDRAGQQSVPEAGGKATPCES